MLAVVVAAVLAAAVPQQPEPGPAVPLPPPPGATHAAGPLRLFLDCPTYICDLDFMRTEVSFVDYMRDRHDAQVYVLVTTAETGSGGTEYTLTFIGQEQFTGLTDTLRFHSLQADGPHQLRRGIARILRLGLARYAAGTPLADHLDLHYDAPSSTGPAPAQSARDPWNNWVFTVGASGFFQGQQATSSRNLSGRLRANRVTDRWKINLSANANSSHSFYQIDSVNTYTSSNNSYSGNVLVVRSLGPHWSAGGQGTISSSTFNNTSLRVRGGPALEFDFYPYGESTRRLVTLNYFLGGEYNSYQDTTIFLKTSEAHPVHSLSLAVSATQPWGNVSVSISASQYLHDLSKQNVNFFGGTDLRLVRGLSISFFGSYSIIRDQLYLPKAGATQQDILAQQQQLATSYNYFVSVGLSYTFGSIHNNVVNPRFGGGGGTFFISN
jgi:hypothetical protein